MEISLTSQEVQDSSIIKIQLLVKPLYKTDAQQLIDNLIDDKLYSSKINNVTTFESIVKKGTPIFCLEKESSEHKHVQPQENQPNQYFEEIDNRIDYDSNNISISEGTYLAKYDGVFLIIDNEPKVIPIYYDRQFEVRISDDLVSLLLDIFPPSNDQNLPQLEDILNEISTLGKIVNVDSEVITSSLNVVLKNREPLKDIIISMGDLPVDGKDGWLEIVAKKEQRIIKDKSDNIFANHNNSYLSIGKDQLIAIIHPAIEGFDGIDIFDKTIQHKKAKDINVKLTSNIYSKEDDENQILSKVDGFLEIYEKTIYVKELLDIKGNIDVNTGNIKAYGSLMVYGNVVTDMKLNLSQNLTVNGYVGDADIEVGNNAVIKGGFLGSGNGVIRAGGNLELKFIENQKVYSRGSLVITKEAINSELFVRDKIVSNGPHCTIIGGYAIASESIEIYSAGNEYNTNTILEVGIDYQKKLYLKDYIHKLVSLKKEMELVDKEIIDISSMRRKTPNQCERIKFLANRHTEIANEMELLKEKRNQLFGEINKPTTSKIIVKNIIYPGVKLIINGKQKQITEKLYSKTFLLSKEGEIVTA